MIIDCASCVARPTECGDCVVSVVLLGPHVGSLDLDADEQTAVAVLAGSGLVPPLRLMPASAAAPESDAPGGQDGVQDAPPRVGTKTPWSRRQRAG